MHTELIQQAATHITDILADSIKHTAPHKAVVIYDTEYGLTNILTAAYRIALPNATYIEFTPNTKDEILAIFDTLVPDDLVVLIQSTNFRLNEFRIRLHLFEKKLKVIEHLHLVRNSEPVWDVYVNSLAYDKDWLQRGGRVVAEKLDKTNTFTLESHNVKLSVSGGLEKSKLNIGDYTGFENIGGTFPIGEVFTEANDFTQMNGSCYIYAFADSNFHVQMFEPFRIDITEGLITSWEDNTPQSFVDIINMVKMYERPLIREIGLGLNKAITKERYIEDITAFERIHGMHFSLGEKHSVYKKSGITTNKTKFHIDIFPVVNRILCDDDVLFEDNTFLV
jgi:hypothetical protein